MLPHYHWGAQRPGFTARRLPTPSTHEYGVLPPPLPGPGRGQKVSIKEGFCSTYPKSVLQSRGKDLHRAKHSQGTKAGAPMRRAQNERQSLTGVATPEASRANREVLIIPSAHESGWTHKDRQGDARAQSSHTPLCLPLQPPHPSPPLGFCTTRRPGLELPAAGSWCLSVRKHGFSGGQSCGPTHIPS